MSDYVPMIERVEIVRAEDSDVARVWYRVSSPGDAKLHPVKAGDWVLLMARVNTARQSGGYVTGAVPPGAQKAPPVESAPVDCGLEFRLEQNEIYFLPGLASPRPTVLPEEP